MYDKSEFTEALKYAIANKKSFLEKDGLTLLDISRRDKSKVQIKIPPRGKGGVPVEITDLVKGLYTKAQEARYDNSVTWHDIPIDPIYWPAEGVKGVKGDGAGSKKPAAVVTLKITVDFNDSDYENQAVSKLFDQLKSAKDAFDKASELDSATADAVADARKQVAENLLPTASKDAKTAFLAGLKKYSKRVISLAIADDNKTAE